VNPTKKFPDPIIDHDYESVYSPSDDTYLLIDYFKAHIDDNYFDDIPIDLIQKLLDMGTGTGIVALFFQLIKKIIPNFKPKIYASDILKEAVIRAKINEKLNGFENEIEFIQSDLFSCFPEILKHAFDVIIFNPPYLPSSNLIHEHENKARIDYSWDGGTRGNDLSLRFLDEAKNYINLHPKSRVYYISSSRVNLNKMLESIKAKGYQHETLEKKHVFFEDLYLNRLKMK